MELSPFCWTAARALLRAGEHPSPCHPAPGCRDVKPPLNVLPNTAASPKIPTHENSKPKFWGPVLILLGTGEQVSLGPGPPLAPGQVVPEWLAELQGWVARTSRRDHRVLFKALSLPW
jgi:hypothetical protein